MVTPAEYRPTATARCVDLGKGCSEFIGRRVADARCEVMQHVLLAPAFHREDEGKAEFRLVGLVELREFRKFRRREPIEPAEACSLVEVPVSCFASASLPARSGCARISVRFLSLRFPAHALTITHKTQQRYPSPAESTGESRFATQGECSKMPPKRAMKSGFGRREGFQPPAGGWVITQCCAMSRRVATHAFSWLFT